MHMELYEANRILRTAKTAICADDYKLPSAAETDGLLMLLGKLDAGKYLTPKIKHTLSLSGTARERENKRIVFFRALTLMTTELPDPVTVTSLLLVHRALAGDVIPDAGKLRTAPAATDGNAHTDPKYISGSLKSIISKMNEIGSAPNVAKEDFAGYLSHYMRELIILRPFDSFSDFTVRIFLAMFCKNKGYVLGLYRTTPQAIKGAENQAFTTDDIAPLYTVLTDCLMYEKKTASAPPRTPRTKREAAKDLTRPSRAKPTHRSPAPPHGKELNDDIIRRAVKLQQKISRLNEQLAELIKPLENVDDE